MSRRRFTAEQIIGMLREAEVELSGGNNVGQICRGLGICPPQDAASEPYWGL